MLGNLILWLGLNFRPYIQRYENFEYSYPLIHCIHMVAFNANNMDPGQYYPILFSTLIKYECYACKKINRHFFMIKMQNKG